MASSYANRPVWQWAVLIVVILVVIYAAVHFAMPGNQGQAPAGMMNDQMTPPTTPTTTPTGTNPVATNPTTPKANPQVPAPVVVIKQDLAKGSYLSDGAGRTLYTYSADSLATSRCTGTCAKSWPAYTVKGAVPAADTLPASVSTFKRSDGTSQYAWKGLPLYYYVGDAKAGQITGDGLNGFMVGKD